jgi:hypothetical protein
MLRQKIDQETRLISYVNNTSFLMEAGGIITGRNPTPPNLLTITNLSSSVEEKDLHDLFEPYADI